MGSGCSPDRVGWAAAAANVEFRDRHYGALIGRPFGEGLVASAPLPVTDPRHLLFGEGV